MRIRIAKTGESLFDGTAISVSVPGSEGDMTILPNHAPLITALRPGTIRVTPNEGDELAIPVEKGILEVSENEVIILL